MNAHAFGDALRRQRSTLNRRSLSAIALSVAFALGRAWPPGQLAARKRRKKRKKRKQQIVRNAFGCVDVGMPCGGDSANCCSGICEGNAPQRGKKDASRCAAHNVGGCTADVDVCTGISPICGDGGACFRTTGNASFCGKLGLKCVPCQKDQDCESFFGASAACTVCTSECGEIAGGTACRSTAATGS